MKGFCESNQTNRATSRTLRVVVMISKYNIAAGPLDGGPISSH